MSDSVNAAPTKRLFIKMLTRDLSLEDVVLDLVDNAIDSVCRRKKIDLSSLALLKERGRKSSKTPDARIDIHFDQEKFVVEDSCGGISIEDAKENVFRMGKVVDSEERGALSVYGIGLKRAVFKIGRVTTVESHTDDEGFEVEIDTDKWLRDDNSESPDWTLPLETLAAATARRPAGTKITVSKLYPEVKDRFSDDTFDSRLRRIIGSTYALFLNRYVLVRVNGVAVEPADLPLASSREVAPGFDQFARKDVEVSLLAGITTRPYQAERAGWYVFCNGRVVVSADKSELTGWGGGSGGGLPIFVSKFSGFVGYAFFYSTKPESLPWTTTKRGLNWESEVYLTARQRMKSTARPVLDFLGKMYEGEEVESPAAREMAEKVQPAKLDALLRARPTVFAAPVKVASLRSDVSIQYKVKRQELERVRKALRRPTWGATHVGRATFDYFLKQECSE